MQCSHYVFDAYGTLFDVHASIRKYEKNIGENSQRISEIWRQKQLEYTWTLTLMGEYQDFWKLTENALEFAIHSTGANIDDELKQKLLKAYWELECFVEVPEVLKKLKEQKKKVAILSNGSSKMIKAAVDSAKLEEYIDDTFSVDEINIFKPRSEVYDMVCKTYEVKPQDVCFQSSNRWDIAGAKKFGFKTIWINRSGQKNEYEKFQADRIVDNLKEIVI